MLGFKLIRIVLWPFSLLYHTITLIRNRLYDLGFFGSQSGKVKTILVGNIRVGGTGKTPMVESIASHLLGRNVKIALLSRGYGRKTTGFRQADHQSDALQIGDEPLLFLKKWGGEVPVFVGEKRVEALEKIAKIRPDTELVLLDDAFQHRSLRADFNIVLTEYDRPFFEDYLMPFGFLRESRQGVARANMVVVTKCPNELNDAQMTFYQQRIREYCKPQTPIFFTSISYFGAIHAAGLENRTITDVVLVCGIANPAPFIQHCNTLHKVHKVFEFPDHHEYTLKDAEEVTSYCESILNKPVILVTEKDVHKLKSLWLKSGIGDPLYYR
jgi:tetraacyldisaccharide 4'-kinase